MKPLAAHARAMRAIADDERSWVCATCNTMIEVDGEKYCRTCKMYWDDVKAGAFDDYEDSQNDTMWSE